MIFAIWAQNPEGIIGDGKKMPWHIPDEMKHFMRVTMNSTVVMGRRTWESIGSTPLKGRRNIVLSRTLEPGDGYDVVPSFDELNALVQSLDGDVFIIGGAELYEKFLPIVDAVIMTTVDMDVNTAYSVTAPKIDPDDFPISFVGPWNGENPRWRVTTHTHNPDIAEEIAVKKSKYSRRFFIGR